MIPITTTFVEQLRSKLVECRSMRPHRVVTPELAYGRHRGPHRGTAKPCGVLVSIVGPPEQCHIPLMLRPEHLTSHPGQISLPGGRLHGVEDAWEGSKREFEEELGVSSDWHEPIGPMSSIFVFASRHIVFPWLSRIEQDLNYMPNRDEVRLVVRLRLDDLLHNISWERRRIHRGTASFWAPGFSYDGHFIWGATAMILNELRVLIALASES